MGTIVLHLRKPELTKKRVVKYYVTDFCYSFDIYFFYCNLVFNFLEQQMPQGIQILSFQWVF